MVFQILPFRKSGTIILPLTAHLERPRRHIYFTKPYVRLFLATSIIFSTLFFLSSTHLESVDSLDQELLLPSTLPLPSNITNELPPLYERFHEYERNLPQHSELLPAPEGKDAKYLWYANHAYGSGWGNAMQEMIFNAHLAYASNRAYVFDNYTWNRDGPDYSEYNGKKIPSRIPVSTMLSGPIIGGPFDASIKRPRAVSYEYFKKVCPNPTIIATKEYIKSISDLSGPEYLDRWTKKLLAMPDRCVEIQRDDEVVFSIWVFGDHRSAQLFPEINKSPVLRQLDWAPLIRAAYLTNRALFEAPSALGSFLSYLNPFNSRETLPPSHRPPIPGLLAVHIRRGDFDGHCAHFANWSSKFNGLNTLEGIPDRFETPPGGGAGSNTPENTAIYMRRCYPTIEQIVEKITSVRAGSAERDRSYKRRQGSWGLGRGMETRKIHIMTNGKKEWIEELKAKLREKAEWDSIVSSRDLELTWEQKYVSQAVDMYIGERAQEFIGNGFSSLTSNVVLLRMAHGYAPETTHMW